MKRSDLLSYVSICLDDAGSLRSLSDMPKDARLVVYQCGFEPLVVAVWSYLPDTRLGIYDAEDIAKDYLIEHNWFSDCANPSDADYII